MKNSRTLWKSSSRSFDSEFIDLNGKLTFILKFATITSCCKSETMRSCGELNLFGRKKDVS